MWQSIWSFQPVRLFSGFAYNNLFVDVPTNKDIRKSRNSEELRLFRP